MILINDGGKVEKREKLMEYFDGSNPKMKGNLSEALYSLGEEGCFPDYVDSVSEEQAVLLWRVVEKLRKSKFPCELCM